MKAVPSSFSDRRERRRRRKELARLRKAIHRMSIRQKDLLSPEARQNAAAFQTEVASYLADPHAPPEGASALLDRGDKLAGKLFPRKPWQELRENVEIFLVAIAAALAIRAYFLQPFKIPTDSMKPTLYGIQTIARTEPPPAVPVRLLEMVLFGKQYHYLRLSRPATLVDLVPGKFFLEYTDLLFDDGQKRRVWIPAPTLVYKVGLRPGLSFRAGEPVFNFASVAGDQVLVNKAVYNFRKPKRGEVFVFRTAGIEGIESTLRDHGLDGSLFYIKRCVGVPGDHLQIDPPILRINGSPRPPNAAMARVEAGRDGYHGYVILPGQQYLRSPAEEVVVPKDGYWAMGDNSPDSQDSRFWGPVPRHDLVGTGLFVYWPFSFRWGWIH
ncbi:Signal peptidase I [Methylacidimicrobium sp. AP8]|uniref:signal peptidase I n=1 Tax=Methylacidimicrobium sp. AP8 TaxID=2730359 RepID=UPI0018C08AE6|nr:signal peptidase I [Methylacidimicrobium sp. AP8]CAB4244424.1 Signal peptidase I [Methylacidimicrobium sp. AP8]